MRGSAKNIYSRTSPPGDEGLLELKAGSVGRDKVRLAAAETQSPFLSRGFSSSQRMLPPFVWSPPLNGPRSDRSLLRMRAACVLSRVRTLAEMSGFWTKQVVRTSISWKIRR